MTAIGAARDIPSTDNFEVEEQLRPQPRMTERVCKLAGKVLTGVGALIAMGAPALVEFSALDPTNKLKWQLGSFAFGALVSGTGVIMCLQNSFCCCCYCQDLPPSRDFMMTA